MMDTVLPLNTWKRFVNEGTLDSSRISKQISESWYRCKKADINPYQHEGTNILSKQELETQKEKNKSLFNVAQPNIDRLYDSITSLGMMALIIDPDGYVLSVSGNKEILYRASAINFVEGIRWTESEVGTNAIGTVLQIGEPIMITGSEHYTIASHYWSCAAAPIRNDNGKLLGVIDISCPVERSHPFMLGMVTSVAFAIERELSVNIHKDEKELLQKSINYLESKELVAICNNHHEIVFTSHSLRERFMTFIGTKLEDLQEFGLTIQLDIPIYSDQRHAHMIGRAIYLKDQLTLKANSFFIPSVEKEPFLFKGETGTSEAFQKALVEMKLVAKTDASVCIYGETGTGKELCAHSIHENSSRKNGPFVAVNCGAIHKELIASELFGYVDGAFTGARRQGYKGKFEQANNGTIFLDEIGEISESMQVSLLRVLQERTITPIGGTKEIPLNIRVIAATNRNLSQMVHEGTFREDLYYRLHVYPVTVPSLRDRKKDIPHLIRYFCQKNTWDIKIPDEILLAMCKYDWPGNIRELVNMVERINILVQGGVKHPEQLQHFLPSLFGSKREKLAFEKSSSDSSTNVRHTEKLTLRENIQKEQMIQALQKTNGNVTLAAEYLNIPRSTFYKRIRKFNL
ncbi:acetoin dehydrogenase [Bacillus sp. SA1-12]|uniref:sigma-54-dependent Fis family transcriptional regulator n=1 Tax=Bacillus sp. SA1-12 TaxID=1455638 RepID=UPI0006262DBF|nr:sigma-54-dependent Fis family transcriptional regulator [Bacillus sp. SA1-12]KKI91984.1 acetoin dehydrogenase [Bacillus sp. SA1-12]